MNGRILALAVVAMALFSAVLWPRSESTASVGGSISGTVTDEDTGVPLEDIALTFSATSHDFGGGTRTDANGDYSILGLAADDYVLHFNSPNTGMYLSEWYDDQPDRESATLVTVTEEEKTAGIDVALALGGSINGTVTDENTGEPPERICVSASDVSGGWFGHAITDASGDYSAGGLRTGDYKVNFYDCSDGRSYKWYDDQPDRESAGLVAVTEKEKTEGIDGALTVTPASTMGDVNCDDVVNAIDAALVLQLNAGLLGSVACAEGADVNGDGDITSVDAALILQFSAGLIDLF